MSWLTLDMLARARGDGLIPEMQCLLEKAGRAAPKGVIALADRSEVLSDAAGPLPAPQVENADMKNVTLFPKQFERAQNPARKIKKDAI